MDSVSAAGRWLGLFADGLTHLRSIVLSVLLLGLTGSILWVLWRETQTPVVVISDVQVPEVLTKRGYTGDVVMNQMAAELRHIDHKSQSHLPRADLKVSSAQVDVQVPGTGLSFRWLVHYVKDILDLGRQDTTINGAIIQHDGDLVELRLIMTGPLGGGTRVFKKGSQTEIDAVLKAGAEDATSIFNPYVLGSYHVGGVENGRCQTGPPCNVDRAIEMYARAIEHDVSGTMKTGVCDDLKRLGIITVKITWP